MNEVKLGCKIKKVQDVVKNISRDFEEVDRGAIITLEIPAITEGDLRRLQRVALNGHVVLAELSSPQLELGEYGDEFEDGEVEDLDSPVEPDDYEKDEFDDGEVENVDPPVDEVEDPDQPDGQVLTIGQEVVVNNTGEIGVVNDVSPGGVLVKLGGEDSDGNLVPMGLNEVAAL